MKLRLIVASTLGLAAAVLASCAQEAAAPVEEAAPDGLPGITVAHARLVLPAVKGNPGAGYFDISYDDAGSDRPAMIRGVHVAGAGSAMLHSSREMAGTMHMEEVMQLPVENGGSVSFAPGGYHVMAMNLDENLAPGDTTEFTVTFVGGDKVSFPAEVRAPGDAEIAEEGAAD